MDEKGRLLPVTTTDFSYDMLGDNGYRVRLLGTGRQSMFHMPPGHTYRELMDRVRNEARKLREQEHE